MCISFRKSRHKDTCPGNGGVPNPRVSMLFVYGVDSVTKNIVTYHLWLLDMDWQKLLYWMCVFVLSGVFTSFAWSISKKHAGGRNRGTFFPTNHTLPSTEADVRCGHWWYLRNVGGGKLPSPTHPTDVTPLSCDPTFRDSWEVMGDLWI